MNFKSAATASLQANLLIVDDQPDNLRVLAAILDNQGYKLRKATSGSMALASIQAELPDLILLDIKMPLMDGYEVCARLKADPKTYDIPIIFLSGLDSAADKVKAFELGGADYITRPFQAEEVLVRIKQQLLIRQQQQLLTAQNIQLQKEIHERQQVEVVLRQQADRERLIAATSQRIRQSLRLTEILDTAVAEVRQILRADRVFILQMESDQSHTVVAESVDSTYPSALHPLRQINCERCWQMIYYHNQVNIINDCLTNATQPFCQGVNSLQTRAQLAVPIPQRERVWGLLFVHHCADMRVWQTWEIDLLEQLTDQLAIAIQQADLYQQLQWANQELQHLVTKDGLTGIANRRRFDDYLNQEWQRLQQLQQPLSLILCDIDHFKRYNDYYGHLAGDRCLKQIAQALEQSLQRSTDLVVRYGGEEFAVILPETDAKQAIQIAQRFQMEIAALQIPHGCSSVNAFVTLSIGIASQIPTSELTTENLIAATDQALYMAKAQGRNTYCCNCSEQNSLPLGC